jgi:hypothetical protein
MVMFLGGKETVEYDRAGSDMCYQEEDCKSAECVIGGRSILSAQGIGKGKGSRDCFTEGQ